MELNRRMLVQKKRLIELVNHEDQRVRRASAKALEKFFPCSEDVIEHFLKAIDTYKDKEDVLSLAVGIKYFTPTKEDLKEILGLFIELADETDEHAVNLQWHLRNSLFEFPFQLLENNYPSLSFNKHLLETYEIAKNQEQVKCLEPEVLWEELTTLCNRYRNKKTESHDSAYGHLLVKSLSKKQKGEKIKHRLIMYLSQETDVNYYLEDYLVELAGNLKLVETVPYLFRILIDSDSIHYVRGTCMKSLGQIGTPGW